MRNLKKILAVITIVAMLAAMTMVPALAAGFTYETQATTLNTLNVMAGMNLGDDVTRIQGLTFAIKAAGKNAAALALTTAEVDAALANVTDADKIPAWGKNYAAYAVINAFTAGVDASVSPKVKFGAMDLISGANFLTWVLDIGMGYSDSNPTTAVADAVAAKVITINQAVAFASKATLIRDDVAGILYGAVDNGVNKDGTLLVNTLIAAGLFTQQAAADVGLATAPAPLALAVETITSLNNKQVKVTFNMDMDSASAETKSFYTRAGVALAATDLVALQADKKSVVITLNTAETNQTNTKFAVNKDIKAADGSKLAAKVEKEVSFVDTTIPSFVKVEQNGPKQIKVFFSEPVKASSAGFKVDNGILSGTVGTISNQDYSVVVSFGTNLSAGNHTLKINPSNNKDVNDYFAAPGLAVPETEVTFVMVADTTAPVVVSTVANSQTEVDVTFDETVDISGLAAADIYHTASGYVATGVAFKAGSDKIVRITFTGNPLPSGSPTIYIAKEKIKDLFGNKVAALTLTAAVTIDITKPTASLNVANDAKLEITWSEGVSGSTVPSNYVIKDSLGVALTSKSYSNSSGNPVATITFDSATKKTTIDFGSNHLPAGAYKLTVSGIKDTALIANIMDEITVDFTVTDGTKPTVGATGSLIPATATVGQKIIVTFSESMGESILASANYILNNAALPDNTTLAAGTDSKSVIITLPLTTTITTAATLQVGQVADASGNKTAALATSVTLGGSSSVAYVGTSFKATSRTTVTFEVSYPLASITAANFTVGGAVPAAATYENKTLADGSTYGALVTLTVADAAKWLANATPAVVINASAGADALGRNIATGTENAADKISPALDELSSGEKKIYAKDLAGANRKIDAIEITYNENILSGSVATGTYLVDGYTVTAVGVVGAVVTLTVTEKDTADTAAAPRVKQIAEIRDNSAAANVKAVDADFVASIDGTVPTISSVALNTVTGAANDVLTITFSESMKEAIAEATAVLDDIAINTAAVSAAAGTKSLTLSEDGKVLTVVTGKDYNLNDAFIVKYTTPGDATALIDTSVNANILATSATLTGFVGGEVADVTAPAIVSVTIGDGVSFNAAADTLTIVFSEKVRTSFAVATAPTAAELDALFVPSAGAFAGTTYTATDLSTTAGITLVITAAGAPTTPIAAAATMDTAVAPTANDIEDVAGNDLNNAAAQAVVTIN